MLSIQGSGSYCFPVISPGHRPWMSSPPWVDIFWLAMQALSTRQDSFLGLIKACLYQVHGNYIKSFLFDIVSTVIYVRITISGWIQSLLRYHTA
jgi:hypothetical protein